MPAPEAHSTSLTEKGNPLTEVWARASPFPALSNADWKSSLELCAPNPDLGREQVPLLEATARRLLSAIEAALEPLEGKRIDGPIRGVIVEAQHQTWEALRLHLEPVYVNRIRRECGLLTVCYGSDELQHVDSDKLSQLSLTGYRWINGDGCGIVYPGSRKRVDQRQCPECRKSQTRRWEHFAVELEAQHLAGKIKIAAQSFPLAGKTINRRERWSGPCQLCGRRFESLRPDTKRCDECRN